MEKLTDKQRHAIRQLLRVPSNLPENAKHNNLVIDLVLAFLRSGNADPHASGVSAANDR